MQSNALLDGATISFTHFTTMMHIGDFTRELLDESYHAGLALICPPNQKGADLIIPVRLHSGSFTAIFGQVKNYANSPQSTLGKPATVEILPSEWLEESHSLRDLKPVATLYHQVGALEGKTALRERHVSITGLCSDHLPTEISHLLHAISNTRVDARAPVWVTSKGCHDLLHNYLPLAYPAAASGIGAVRLESLCLLLFFRVCLFRAFAYFSCLSHSAGELLEQQLVEQCLIRVEDRYPVELRHEERRCAVRNLRAISILCYIRYYFQFDCSFSLSVYTL